MNLTITKTITRLGMVFFLFIFNIGISIFVFLLTGIMIFSQILFIIYAMFLPMSFLLSMIPGFDNMAKHAIMKLFNVIMTRAGITLIVTVAFSISTMIYTLSEGFPFFLIAFLQIVTFAGIYMKLGDLMGMFNLQANDSKQMGHRIFQKPYKLLNRGTRRLKRKIGRILVAGTTGAAAGAMAGAAASKSLENLKEHSLIINVQPAALMYHPKISQVLERVSVRKLEQLWILKIALQIKQDK